MAIRPVHHALAAALIASSCVAALAADGSSPASPPPAAGPTSPAASPLSEPPPKPLVIPGPSTTVPPKPSPTHVDPPPVPSAPSAPPAAQATPPVPPLPPQAGREGDMRDVFAGRGGDVPAIIRSIQAEGVSITSLGAEGGVKAYLGEAANGRFQVLYASPDGENVAAGLLFRSGGVNVTNGQIESMLARFGDAARATPGLDASSLGAVTPAPGDAKDAPEMPIMDWFRSQGLDTTPFGSGEGGFPAFLVGTPSPAPGAKGLLQAFYVLPDPRYAVAGMLMRRGGVNVTGLQIADTRMREVEQAKAVGKPAASAVNPGINPPPVPVPPPDVRDALAHPAAGVAGTPAPGLAVRQEDATAATPPEAVPPKPSGHPVPPTVPPDSAAPVTPAAGAPAPADPGKRADATPAAPAAHALPVPVLATFPNTLPASASAPFRTKTAIEGHPDFQTDFMEALKTAVWFQVGAPEAPVIYMVADPQCPFCHATWQRLKPLVFARQLQVRVLMIAGLAGSDPLARSILARDNPSTAWLDGEGSIQGVPIKQGPLPGSPNYDRTGHMLNENMNFIHRFHIDRTPFLAYVSDDGTMYSSLGLPENLDAFLAARR